LGGFGKAKAQELLIFSFLEGGIFPVLQKTQRFALNLQEDTRGILVERLYAPKR